ncbi:hypothetical protein [Haloferula sp. BvORR071]|uniref:hypothetical protein n=1 Tax=Haloferula sp. BvORR071 TaxID=1396141 RepID=UPI000558DE41|nr:hypothetical protein [Haloferula sp. BvORR071]
MKTLAPLFAALPGLAFAADLGTVPKDLAPAGLADIRTTYDAARHAPQRQEDGDFVARNPGQQWSAEFDGRASRSFPITEPGLGAWI